MRTSRPQNSKFAHQEIETEVTHQTMPSYSKSQQLYKVSRFVYDEKSQKTSTINMERTKNYSGPLKSENARTETSKVITWQSRMVAVGAARGLRYLHEECCVGDFGLARWQADRQSAEETHIIGSFGYLAPEYTQTGLITEMADVYAFGVVLLELLSGLKATDLTRSEEKQYLPEWVLRILEGEMAYEHGGLITSTLVHKMKNSFGRRLFHETKELGTSHQMHRTMVSSTNIILNNSERNKVGTKPTYLDKFGENEVNDSWNMEQTEDFHSEEFRAYLKGSLAKSKSGFNSSQDLHTLESKLTYSKVHDVNSIDRTLESKLTHFEVRDVNSIDHGIYFGSQAYTSQGLPVSNTTWDGRGGKNLGSDGSGSRISSTVPLMAYETGNWRFHALSDATKFRPNGTTFLKHHKSIAESEVMSGNTRSVS
ncbi:hypothetical protein Sjap_008883 [Stephania japonica]|uniref:Protein kinase domain-containing protein n=1 Tax=Stephania japonica TaxID=461633 RepID=A0AAP0JR50_9MAGN